MIHGEWNFRHRETRQMHHKGTPVSRYGCARGALPHSRICIDESRFTVLTTIYVMSYRLRAFKRCPLAPCTPDCIRHRIMETHHASLDKQALMCRSMYTKCSNYRLPNGNPNYILNCNFFASSRKNEDSYSLRINFIRRQNRWKMIAYLRYIIDIKIYIYLLYQDVYKNDGHK